MKKILLLFIFAVTFAKAQTVSNRDPQYQIDYEMELVKPGSSIGISTYDSPGIARKALILKTSSTDCTGLKGVRLRLVNGDNLFFDNIPIVCTTYAPNRGNTIAVLVLTDELQAQLEGQEIYEFTLGNIRVPVNFRESGENFVALQKWAKDESGF